MPGSDSSRKKYILGKTLKNLGLAHERAAIQRHIKNLVRKHFNVEKAWLEQMQEQQEAWNELCAFCPEIVVHGGPLQKEVLSCMRALLTKRRGNYRYSFQRMEKGRLRQLASTVTAIEGSDAELDEYDPGGKVSASHIFLGNGWAVDAGAERLSHIMSTAKGTILDTPGPIQCLSQPPMISIRAHSPGEVNPPPQTPSNFLPTPGGSEPLPPQTREFETEFCTHFIGLPESTRLVLLPKAKLASPPDPFQLSVIEVSNTNPSGYCMALVPVYTGLNLGYYIAGAR